MIYTIKDRIGEIDWAGLRPGDTVQIPYRATPYAERIVLGCRGTADAWITVEGIPGPNGELPVIDGTDAVTDPQFALDYPPLEPAGLVTVYPTLATAGVVPGFIEFKNLELRGAKAGNVFAGADGTKKSWANASGFYLLMFDHVTLTNCRVTDCDQGLFTGDSKPCSDILIDGCYFGGNGLAGSNEYHQSYVQCAGATYRNSHWGPKRPGTGAGALKDRSSNVLVEGCTVEASDRLLDFSAWQNETALRQGTPGANKTAVRNCTLVNRTGADCVYLEGRSLADGTPHEVDFSANTVVVRADKAAVYDVRWFYNQYAPEVKVSAAGNLLDATAATAGGGDPEFRAFDAAGTLALGPNWSRNPLSDYAYQPAQRTLTGLDQIKVAGVPPGYANEAAGDYSLVPGAPATGFGATLTPAPTPPAPTPNPPNPPPLSIVKTERVLRVTLSDGTVLYAPDAP